MLVLALLQAVSGPVDAGAIRYGCRPPAVPDEIVVCARPGDSPYRLRPLPARPAEPVLPTAALRLKGGGTLAVEGQRGNVGPIPTNRAVLTLKLPF